MAVTRTFKVYGGAGTPQKESFCDSHSHDFSTEDKVRILEVENFDKTRTHEYTIVKSQETPQKSALTNFGDKLPMESSKTVELEYLQKSCKMRLKKR